VPYDDDDEPRRADQEGVRIIGAEEAAEALGREDVAQRKGEAEPRFGDRPETPEVDGPRPTIRFPLPADEGGEASPSLPHWTDPPTGEVPRIFAVEDLEGGGDDDASPWSSFTTGQPRWRGEGPDLDDDYDDFSRLADDETRVGAMAGDDRPDPEDFFAFDDDAETDAEEQWEEDTTAAGSWNESYDERTRSISSDPRRVAARRQSASFQPPGGAGRNVPVAVGVGVGLAVLLLACAAAGPRYLAALVTVVLAVAAAELYNVLRQAGYQPATLLGLAACVTLPLAAYNKGEGAIALVLFLAVGFGLVWYLAGAGGADRPVIGLSSTLLGVGWIGLLGCFAALVVSEEAGGFGENGVGILLVAILGTVGYDVGGFVVGRNAGTRPLSAASPNKTVEGLLGGILGALFVTIIAGTQIAPLADADFAEVFLIAVGIAVVAPLGDLCESLVKRDLDVKDMGTILPGHGGLLDRFDALLFVLPTVYYLSRVVFT
jgi:phosphatidate cytidylyltransferase